MTRAPGDHGTAQDAIDWVLDADPNPIEAEAFLRGWREGSLEEWPDFYKWLDKRPSSPPQVVSEGSGEGES